MTPITDNRTELNILSYNNRLCKVRADKYHMSVNELVTLTHLALVGKDKEECKNIMEDYVVKFKKISERSLFLTEDEFNLLYKANTIDNILSSTNLGTVINTLIPNREPLEVTNYSVFMQSVIFLLSIYVILIAFLILN